MSLIDRCCDRLSTVIVLSGAVVVPGGIQQTRNTSSSVYSDIILSEK